MATLWLDAAEQIFTPMVKADPEIVDYSLAHGYYATEGVFIGKDETTNAISATEVHISVDHSASPVKGSIQPVPPNSIVAMGFSSVVNEFLARSPTPRASNQTQLFMNSMRIKKPLEFRAEFVTQLVRWSEMYSSPSEDVGGPVDTIIFDTTGPRWLYLKKGCPRSE